MLRNGVALVIASALLPVGSAAAPRGGVVVEYPYCAANHAPASLGAFPAGNVDVDTTALTVNGTPAGFVTGGNAVFVYDSVEIAEGTTVRAVGENGFVLLSLGTLTVAGAVVADGASSLGFQNDVVPGGPGGGAGGNQLAGGTGSGPGGGTQTPDSGTYNGAGGGGFGGAGGDGGTSSFVPAGAPGTGGSSYGDLTTALQGGSGGGAGTAGDVASSGGGGGGAVFLGALRTLTIAPTGTVSARGGVGVMGGGGASGGGSGGGIVLSGQPVVNQGAVSADGAVGGAGGCCGGGGGGGGGRIFVRSAVSAASGAGTYSVAAGGAGQSTLLPAEAGSDGLTTIEQEGGCSFEQPFVCYKAKPTKGSAPFAGAGASLADELETRATSLTKPAALCTPAAAETIALEDDHFESYQIKQTEKHEKVTGIAVTTPFGALTLDTVKPDRMLVPAAQSLMAPPAALEDPNFDAMKCYKAKVSKGTAPLAKGTTVDVLDGFSEVRTLAVKKVSRLCLPVAVDGSVPRDPTRLLACFSVAPAKGEPKHVKRSGVHVTQTFGSEELDTLKEEEYCAPAQLAPVS
jgi:hypothetical protein